MLIVDTWGNESFLHHSLKQSKEDGTLIDQLSQNLGKPVPLVVYNSRAQSLRGIYANIKARFIIVQD